MASINLQPIHDLIVQHPVASVLTVAVCLAVVVAGTAQEARADLQRLFEADSGDGKETAA